MSTRRLKDSVVESKMGTGLQPVLKAIPSLL